jgi:hypothetical protein
MFGFKTLTLLDVFNTQIQFTLDVEYDNIYIELNGKIVYLEHSQLQQIRQLIGDKING